MWLKIERARSEQFKAEGTLRERRIKELQNEINLEKVGKPFRE